LADEIWDHRRGILQGAGAAVGAGCLFFTGGLGSGVCVVAGTSIAAAGVTQSAVDNNIIGGGQPCWVKFGFDAAVNVVAVAAPAASGARLAEPVDQVAANGFVWVESSFGTFVSANQDSCGG